MQPDSSRLFQRHVVSFVANVHRACRKCGAPGDFRDDDATQSRWPNCYVPEKKHQPVGPVCPHCGGKRPKHKERRAARQEWWIIRLPKWLARLIGRIERQVS